MAGGGGGGGGGSMGEWMFGGGVTWGGGGVLGVLGEEKSLVRSSGMDLMAFSDSFLPSSVPRSRAPAMPTVNPAIKAEKELSKIGFGWSDCVMIWNIYWWSFGSFFV